MRKVAAVAALLALVAGCNLLFKVRADKIVILTWLESPELVIPGVFTQERIVTATAVFMDRKGGVEPVPVSGGFAGFFGAGKLFTMVERDPAGAPGVYTATSLDPVEEGKPSLPYDTDENRRYGLKACAVNRDGCIGEEFSITRIRAAPALDGTTIVFDPPLDPPTLEGFSGSINAGTALKVVFPAPPEDAPYRPVVSVLGPSGDPSQPPGPVFNSVPTAGPELIAFLTTEPPLTIEVPADKLATAGIYILLTGSARLSLDTSENLFIGSGAIAGSMNAFFIEVRGEAPVVGPGGLMIPGLPNIPFP